MSSSSGMMALYMPMQPSSKTPMMAFSRASCSARALPTACASADGTSTFFSGVTWSVRVLDRRLCRASGAGPSTKNSSVKSSLHRVEYFTPALVSEPLRLSMPTSPGHVPDQLATVRIGPWWRDQAGQHMVRVLPDRFGHDQRRLGVDAGKDAHALLLRADEAVLFVFLVGMGADQFVARLGHGLGQEVFHFLLLGPACLIGREPQSRRWPPAGPDSCRPSLACGAWGRRTWPCGRLLKMRKCGDVGDSLPMIPKLFGGRKCPAGGCQMGSAI